MKQEVSSVTFDKKAKCLLNYGMEMAMLHALRKSGSLSERQCDEIERDIKKHYHVVSDYLIDTSRVYPYNQ